ncbi:hypothetical protein DBA29_17195 [Xenophilus aerolatus]|nr:hypothetical protein [Xenophilus aerolatus]
MSITPTAAQALQILAQATGPMLRRQIEQQAGHPARGDLWQLRTQGLVASEIGHAAGQGALAHYTITPSGRAALARHRREAAQGGAPAAHRRHGPSGTYEGAELGQTCQRPGAYDAFRHPSRIGGQLVWPRGFAA